MPKKPTNDNPLVTAAKVIGKAAGKVAATAGARAEPESAPEPPPDPGPSQLPRRASKGKLQKKNKPHLPRKMKKTQKKTHTS